MNVREGKAATKGRTNVKRCHACGGILRIEEDWKDPITYARLTLWRCQACGVAQAENRRVAPVKGCTPGQRIYSD